MLEPTLISDAWRNCEMRLRTTRGYGLYPRTMAAPSRMMNSSRLCECVLKRAGQENQYYAPFVQKGAWTCQEHMPLVVHLERPLVGTTLSTTLSMTSAILPTPQPKESHEGLSIPIQSFALPMFCLQRPFQAAWRLWMWE